jgi:hypothetical protein
MKVFFETLPWKLASVGALIVLVIGFIVQVDLWMSLQRTGLAFAGFWIIGLIGRSFLEPPASRSAGNEQNRPQ